MLTLGILVAHLVGDYILQNGWMARRKLDSLLIALFHGFIQGVLLELVVVILRPETTFRVAITIFLVTAVTHGIIDRYRLIKPIIWAMNQIGDSYSWREGKRNNGHPMNTPAWMSTWLMIIADNTLHLVITFVLLISLGVV